MPCVTNNQANLVKQCGLCSFSQRYYQCANIQNIPETQVCTSSGKTNCGAIIMWIPISARVGAIHFKSS
jgi:hypothetical protein